MRGIAEGLVGNMPDVTAVTWPGAIKFSFKLSSNRRHVVSHLEQALTVLLGRDKRAAAFTHEDKTGLTLADAEAAVAGSGLCPLPNPGNDEDPLSFWRAFELLLTYLEKHDTDVWDPVSNACWEIAVCFGPSHSTWSRCVVLCACIEGVLGCGHLPQVEPRTPTDEDRRLVELVKEARFSAGYLERVEQWCSRRQPTAAAGPRLLVNAGVWKKEHLKVWERIRNKFLHGKSPNEIDQAFVDDQFVLLDAFFRCVLQSIAYTGKRKNYANHGWPIVQFPDLPVEGKAEIIDASNR